MARHLPQTRRHADQPARLPTQTRRPGMAGRTRHRRQGQRNVHRPAGRTPEGRRALAGMDSQEARLVKGQLRRIARTRVAGPCRTAMGRAHARVTDPRRNPGMGQRAGRKQERHRRAAQPRNPARHLRADAVSDRLIPSNPCDGIETPRKKRKEHTYLTIEQLFRLADESGDRRTMVRSCSACAD